MDRIEYSDDGSVFWVTDSGRKGKIAEAYTTHYFIGLPSGKTIHFSDDMDVSQKTLNWLASRFHDGEFLDLTKSERLEVLEYASSYFKCNMAVEITTFLSWYHREKADIGWLKDVPVPPNQLRFFAREKFGGVITDNPNGHDSPGEAILPSGWVWDSTFAMNVLRYHPNATYGNRRKSDSSEAGAQAMYDAKGRIITSGLSAGTADKVSPNVSTLRHRAADVIPYDQAKRLDGYASNQSRNGKDYYRKLYMEVRPPNTHGAKPNHID